ncbi:hypothetical protein D3C80_1092800 [compost metagenome]
MGTGAVALGELLCGRAIVAGFIQGQALPLRVLEPAGGGGGLLPLEQTLPLLVGAQPQVVEFERIAWLWQAQQQRQAEQPATSASTGRQQQQRQQ